MTDGMRAALDELDLEDWILQLTQMTARMEVISSMQVPMVH